MLKIFSQEDFALKSKLWPAKFLEHLPIFAGNLRFTGISKLWAGKIRSKKFLPLFHIYRYSESWVHKNSVGTCPEKFPVENFRWQSDLKKNPFSRISISFW